MSKFICWLPPNLSTPTNNIRVPALSINICEIVFLQTFGYQPVSIKYKWWGLNNKSVGQSLSQTNHQFPISVSVSMFLKYCTDMKILQFELCNAVGVCTVKGHLNFMLLTNWQGEQIQLVADLQNNKNNAKIGELKLCIQIIEMDNPLYQQAQRIQPNTKNNGSYEAIEKKRKIQKSLLQQKATPKNKRGLPSLSSYEQKPNKQMNYLLNFQKDFSEQEDNIKDNIPKNPLERRYENQKYKQTDPIDTRTRLFKKLYLPLEDNSCICSKINSNKYNLQKIKLKEEIDLFFNQGSIEDPDNFSVEIIGWESFTKSERNLPCKVIMPLLDSEGNVTKNQYYFSNGKGIIKVVFNTKKHPQEKLKEFLVNNHVQVIIGNSFNGHLPMSKLLGSRGQIVSVGVSSNTGNKKEVLKGHCMMKLIIQSQQQVNQNNQNKIKDKKTIPKQPNNEEGQMSITKDDTTSEQQYIWIYLKQLHFLQASHWKDSNIYISIKTEDGQIKSKTIWKTDCPVFNHIMTMKMPKTVAIIQVWNRQATQRLIGKANLKCKNQKQQYNKEIPITDNYGRVIAYLNLCIGKGDITQATQFLNAHADYLFQHENQKISKESPVREPQMERKKQKNISQKSQKGQNSHNQQTSNNFDNNDIDINSQSSYLSKHPPSLIHPPFYRQQSYQNLTVLQLHNIIFTRYFQKNYDWFQTYQNKYLNVSEFQKLIKPLIEPFNAIKFISVYFNQKVNQISLDQVKQSYQAFKVYYQILVNERDDTLIQVLQFLHNQGISINDIQRSVRQKLSIGIAKKNDDALWKALKQSIEDTIVEKIRYFYEGCQLQDICDEMRKFQVYETTKGQQIPDELIAGQIFKQITELLQIDPNSPTIQTEIKEAGLQLSKYELWSLIGQVSLLNQHSKMIKSPTFGLLKTDKIKYQQTNNVDGRDNYSMKMHESQGGSDELSSKFKNPGVSSIIEKPVNQHFPLIVRFSNVQQNIQKITINGRQLEVKVFDNESNLYLEISRQQIYEGWMSTSSGKKLEFDGPPGEWLGLIDEMGGYNGCVYFQ